MQTIQLSLTRQKIYFYIHRALKDPAKFITSLRDYLCTLLNYLDKIGHAVFVAGRTRSGLIKIKDPFDQTSYKMTKEDFFNHWGGEVIGRWIPETK